MENLGLSDINDIKELEDLYRMTNELFIQQSLEELTYVIGHSNFIAGERNQYEALYLPKLVYFITPDGPGMIEKQKIVEIIYRRFLGLSFLKRPIDSEHFELNRLLDTFFTGKCVSSLYDFYYKKINALALQLYNDKTHPYTEVEL
jgi:hypothetical protein